VRCALRTSCEQTLHVANDIVDNVSFQKTSDGQRPVVIITGASRGIGAALVPAYVNAGYNVVATSRSIQTSTDPNVFAVAGDIGDPHTAARVTGAAVERFGRLDTLVNNAGIFVAKPFLEYTDEDYESVVSTNLKGFFNITQRALAIMEPQGFGHVVTITASLADQPIEGVPAALASLTKGALNAATKGLAIEYASREIRVNAVAPGVIDTPMHAENSHAALAAMHPLRRMGEVADVVSAVMYLENASFVTGEVAYVDGGLSAGR
jgi:NAD(P)-dependent dehydrogenase (short-subunit alcohol dehydrogenase family)